MDDAGPLALDVLKTPSASAGEAPRPTIVIVGAGFAGLAAVRALRHADAEIVLIDRRNHHIFQPLLYQVATATLSAAEIAAPIRQLEKSQANLNVLQGEVTGVDLEGRKINVSLPGSRATSLKFDQLVVASGATPSYFGHDEFAPHAPALKSLKDAELICSKLLSALERAETSDDEAERARLTSVALVGAGPTGVELAASLAQMVQVTLRGNFRRIDPAKVNIFLLDGAKRVLPAFGEAVSRKVAARLSKLGVKVLTGVQVEKVDDEGVIAGGKRIPCATVLWTAGVAASPIAKMVSAKTDRAGRALVDPFLRIAGVHGVFVIGDAASVAQGDRPVPGVAQAAIQQGHYVGRVIAGELDRRPVESPFHYFDKGNMAVVGKNFAALERGSVHTSGFWTWLVWVFLHILTLPQMQNRLRVQRQWLWSYFTGERASRIIRE